MKYYEPHLAERIEKAKKAANDLFTTTNPTEEQFVEILKFRLAKIYGIGMFSDYFTDRSVDQLVYEVSLHDIASKPREERTTELINENKKELADNLFADWDAGMDDAGFDQLSKDFMETGDFKT